MWTITQCIYSTYTQCIIWHGVQHVFYIACYKVGNLIFENFRIQSSKDSSCEAIVGIGRFYLNFIIISVFDFGSSQFHIFFRQTKQTNCCIWLDLTLYNWLYQTFLTNGCKHLLPLSIVMFLCCLQLRSMTGLFNP